MKNPAAETAGYLNVRNCFLYSLAKPAASRQALRSLSVSVMIAQLSNKDSGFSGAVDDPMLVVDAPGPVAGKAVFQRFGFTGAGEGISNDLTDETVERFISPLHLIDTP